MELFVIRFEKIVRNNFSRPKGARRVAHREVGDNPSGAPYNKKAPFFFEGAFLLFVALN